MKTYEKAQDPIEGFQVVQMGVCRLSPEGFSTHKPRRALGREVSKQRSHCARNANGGFGRARRGWSGVRRSSAREVDQDPSGAWNCTSLNEDVPGNDVPM